MLTTGLRLSKAAATSTSTGVPKMMLNRMRTSHGAFRPSLSTIGFAHPLAATSTSLTQTSIRFKSTSTGQASGSTPSRNVFELGAQLERQSEIIENIKQAKQNIVQKQNSGRQLAINVADAKLKLSEHIESGTPLDATLQIERFERQQRFTMFVEKMMQLYRSEKRLARHKTQLLARMELAPVQSMTPIKACLQEYAKLATKGFNCDSLAQSLKLLNQAVAAAGNDPLAMNDLTLSDMDQSWRLDKVTQDIRFGLDPNPNVFFSPYNMAQVSRELGQLGYKNTDLMPLWFNKLDAMLARPSTQDYIEGAQVSFDQAQFGGMLQYVPRHYIYQGFSSSQEFDEHVQTLLEYQKFKKEQGQSVSKKDQVSPEMQEVEEAAMKLIEASKGVKDMQQEMEAAVRNVRNQYMRMKEAHDQHGFLQEHKYIHLDLLELQELLIRAGYLHPDEQILNESAQVGTLGMDAACEVFYDMVLNFYPNTLSPQYDMFYNASVRSEQKSAKKKDLYTDLNMHTLSSTLVGLEQQALSYRRDIVDRDYPTEFYEQLNLPEEKWLQRTEHAMSEEQKKIGQRMLSTHVKMERTYLNAWQTFMERTEKVPSVIEGMLGQAQVTQNDLMSSLRALNATRFQAKELRDKICQRFAGMKDQKCDPQAIVDGAAGLAGCSYEPKKAEKMRKSILKKLLTPQGKDKVIEQLSFSQSIELLKALSTPGMANDSQQMQACVSSLLDRINSMHFDIIHNELTFNEFEQLYDCYVNLKYSEVKQLRDLWQSSYSDESLRRAFEQRDVALTVYPETYAAKYDPIKPRVMSAFTESLVKADLKELNIIQEDQTKGPLYRDMFPFTPDLLMSHGGQKVGVFVLNDDTAMRDTYEPCGFTAGKMRLISSAHKLAGKKGTSVLKGVPLAVSSVVDANLREHKLQLRSDFNIGKYLESQGLGAKTSETQVNTQALSDFSAELSTNAVRQAETTSAAFDEFIMQLVTFMQKREKLDSVYEQEQVLASIDELKLQLLKLLSMHVQSLSIHEKTLVSMSLPAGFSTFDQLVTDGLVKPMSEVQARVAKQIKSQSSQLSQFWQGTRQEVEMPVRNASDLEPKSILPELLSQKFFQYDRYHQYADWESKMRQAYDQFNLMELPSQKKDSAPVCFESTEFKRRVPKGIFPDARRPRIVLRPQGAALEADQKEAESMHDQMTKFERSPIKQMVKTELGRNSDLASRDLAIDIKAMTNLQNIKHSLKSDLADQQICDFLFKSLSFTDHLIEEHLRKGGKKQNKSTARLMERDAESFRAFMYELGREARFVSPYDHFFMQEAQKKGRPQDIAAEILKLNQEHLVRPTEEYEAKKEALEKQLEDLLLNYERANEDPFNLSHALPNKVEVTIDVDSFSSVQGRNDEGLRPTEIEKSAQQFLDKERCRAEANFIKARISYKVHSNVELSENEKSYLEAWMKESQSTGTLLSDADVLVPAKPSKLSLADALSPEDFYALNSLSRVDISYPERDQIALNDLVLELALLVDTDTVRQVELGLLESSLKKEWQLRDDFQLVNRRNKEIDLVMHEMEEVAWRAAGQFDEREKARIEELVFFDRGLDAFDNEFLDMDRASFNAFFDEANTYDSRVTLLENWLFRKDEEVRKRVSLPPQQMQRSDQELFRKLDKPLRQARQKLVGQMLTTDEFGENREPKAYKELTTRELHLLAESLSVRLNLFANKYPAFLPQVVRAVMEHKNLAVSDRSMLDTYCKLFELDWRGDASVDNREQFLLSNPIYMDKRDRHSLQSVGEITDKRVTRRIRQACQPYLPDLIAKMCELTKAKE